MFFLILCPLAAACWCIEQLLLPVRVTKKLKTRFQSRGGVTHKAEREANAVVHRRHGLVMLSEREEKRLQN